MTSIGSNPIIPGILPEVQKPKTQEKPVELQTPESITESEPKIKTESTVSLTEPKKESSIIETAKKEIDSSVKEKTTPVSPVKVEDLELAKAGLKKVDTSKKIDRPIPMDPIQKLGAKISEQLNINPKDKDNLIAFIFEPSKSKLFDKFAEKEFSTENIKFLRDAKTILMNPTLRGLQNLYETQIKDLNVGATELNAFKKALDSGKLSDAINKFDSVIKAVVANSNDTFGRFKLSGGIIQAQIEEKLKPEVSVPTNSKEKYSLKDFINNPKISKAFDDFAKKELSFENVAFLHSAKKMLDKGGVPPLPDLANLYINFIDPKSSSALNIPEKDAVAFKTAVENKDTMGAVKVLENILKTTNLNASDTFSRFSVSPECKAAIKQDSIENMKDVASPNGSLKQVLSDPKKAILFENFAKQEFSSENLNFMKELGDVLKNPDIGKLDTLCKKYVLSGSPQELNLSGVNRKAVTDALQTRDLTKVIQSLEGAVKDVHTNLGDTMSRFSQSPELRGNILGPIRSLPLGKQLVELNKMIKSDGIESGIAKTQKQELLEKFVPKKMPTTNENGEFSNFIDSFKEGTKTGLFEKNVVNDVTRALTKFEKALNSPEDGKLQLQALDSLKSEVEKFIKTQGNSSKIEFVQALSERISGAKSDIREKFETTEPGKLYSLNEGISKVMPELKFNPSNPKALDEIKSKVSNFLGKDPKGDLSWAVTTLPEDKLKAEISSLVGNSFKNLKPEVKAQITDKIIEGLHDALPVKSMPGSHSIIINGEEYNPIKKLGEGGMGSVFKYENNKGQAVVVKTFKDPENFYQEAEAHRLSSGKPEHEHPNVSKFIGAVKDSTSGDMWTIQEFANGGSIGDVMKTLNDFKSKGVLSHTDDILVRQYLAKGMVEGMAHINDKRGIMHRDIKPDNFLYSKKDGTVKAADFGLSQKNGVVNDTVGTPLYMSPEILQHKEHDKKTDVWSTGITIDEVMTGKRALEGEGRFTSEFLKPIFDFAEKGDKFSKVKKTDGTDGGESPTAYGKLINKMITANQSERLSFTELKKMPFISDPIGSDERAQALIKTIFEVSAKKERFDSIPETTKKVDQYKKEIEGLEKKIQETEPKDNPLIEDFRGEINELKESLSELQLSLTDLQKEFKGVTVFDTKAEFQKLEKQFSNLI